MRSGGTFGFFEAHRHKKSCNLGRPNFYFDLIDMMKKSEQLSENLEDYLEAISALSENEAGVRPSDIAEELKVKRPSVTAALNSLADKGLVEYEKYKPVTLTKEGKKLASAVQKKHTLLKNFFTDILGVETSEADFAACKMEHAINDTIMRKLSRFIKGLNPCNECEHGSDGTCSKGGGCPLAVPLSSLAVGERALVLCVDKSVGDVARFAGMGLVIGSTVEILRIAPLGDPVVLGVRGSEISLRRSQLSPIMVKKL